MPQPKNIMDAAITEPHLDKSSTKRVSEMVEVLRRRELVRGLTPVKLRQILEDLGPTYVKLGQIMSLRPDFLPEDYCSELAKLQSRANPLPFPTIQAILEKEYNCRWQKIFQSIDETALGSASIAQVHQAVLKDGRKVAVKVQRPDISDIMSNDIQLLKRAVALLKLLGQGDGVVDFNLLLNEFWTIARQEMDFLMEAQNIEEFQHLNRDELRIACPNVHRELTTSRVLVMDFVEGIPLDDTAKLKERGYDLRQLGRRLGENYVKQIVEDGFFHADPHPGNIWIKGDTIVWLDLGMMGRLSNKDRMALKKAILALASHDVYEMKASVLALGVPKSQINHGQLYEDIEDLINRYGDVDFGTLEMGQLTRQIMTTLKANHIAIGPGLSMFARGVLSIEGMMRCTFPEINFVNIFTKAFRLDLERGVDWKEMLGRLRRDGYHIAQKTVQLPEQISDILKMTMSGQTKVNLEVTGSEEPLRRLDKMVNKLVMGILGAALLLSSSLISMTRMTPKILEIPLLGIIGYMAALLLCGRLLWNIFRNR